MKGLKIFSGFLLLMLSAFVTAQIDKQAMYKTLADGSKDLIESELANLERENPTSQILAYQGALTMKKAGFEKGVKNKVKTFKEGAKLLEEEINKNPSNVEYKFLRLTIQEHAPNILGYNKKLKTDKAAIEEGFEKLDPALKSIIVNYAQSSKVLKEADLKGK